MADTPIEEVRRLLARGLPSDAIATQLGLSRESVAAVKANVTRGSYEDESALPDLRGTGGPPASGIYLRRDGKLVPMSERPYETEDHLQALLAEHPGLLAGEEMGEGPRRWLLLAREVAVADSEGGAARWSLDHLFIDQDAIPTLVEVKRSSDTRIRREVIGQLLEYAANGPNYWPMAQLRALFDAGCEARSEDPTEVVRSTLGLDIDVEDWWAKVEANLRLGRLRLVFVADTISRELRRVIEFLNEQMSITDVLGVEVRQYVDETGEYQTLVPRVIGQTEAARDAKRPSSARPKNRWGEAELLDAFRTHNSPEVAARMIRLYEFMRDRGARPSWGTGALPSVTLWLGEGEGELGNPVAVGLFHDNVTIWFDFVRDKRSVEQMRRLAELARGIPGVAPYYQALEDRNWGMHPGMKTADVLSTDAQLRAWMDALERAASPV